MIRSGARLVLTLVAALFLVPAVLGVGIQGRPVLAATAEQEANPVEIDVTVKDGVLAVKVSNARLEDVLREIAELAGLQLELAGDLGPPIAMWFSLPLEEGIRQLVGQNGLAMIFAPTSDGAEHPRLTEIWVSEPQDGHVVTIEPVANDRPLDRVYDGLDRLDRKARLHAVRELQSLDDEAALDDLVLVLAKETDPKIRRLAAYGLGESGSTQALAALSEALGDKDRSVRFHAINGLSKIGGQESAEALTTTLRDPDPAIRLQTVLALQKVGDNGVVPSLTDILDKDKDPRVRRAIVRTLEILSGTEGSSY